MKKQNKLYVLMLILLFAGCKHSQQGEQTDYDYELSYPRGLDTVYVIRTLDQGASDGNRSRKYVRATNAYGEDYFMMFYLSEKNPQYAKERDKLLSFIYPGDTLIMDKDRVIKNLTYEREKARFNRNQNQR